MKLELFEKLIRKVIREEVDMAIEKYTKPINEKLNEISSPKTKFVAENLGASTNRLADGIKDPSLKEIFENTSPLDENQVTSVLDNFKNLQESAFNSDISDQAPVSMGPEAAFMKDYSGLMEAMDKKKNFRP
jgi:hypothetical protein